MYFFRLSYFAGLTALFLLPTIEVGGQAADVPALASAIQQRYERIRDFRADFTHTYAGGVLRRKTVEQGEVAIRKPGKMRWTYTSPERKVFVSDGVKLYSYVPADRQVYVASDRRERLDAGALSGRSGQHHAGLHRSRGAGSHGDTGLGGDQADAPKARARI
jgi:hypothetical protein